MKVVYGHTDSIYVQIDSIDKAKEAAKEIEAHVRKSFPNVMGLEEHPVALEFEKYYTSLGVGITKNRNAGLISWEDDVYLDEPKFVMTGFTAKRVSETKLAKEVQTTVLKMWVEQKTQKQINAYLNRKYRKTINGNMVVADFIKRSRLREERFLLKCSCKKQYHTNDLLKLKWCTNCGVETKYFLTTGGKRPTFGAGIAGVLYGWEKLNMVFDDSYLFLKVQGVNDTFTNPLTGEQRRVEYISATKYDEFNQWTPDWEHYANQVVKKAEPIYKAMGWELSSIRTGRIQQGLDEWW